MNTDYSIVFETASKYCILDSFVDYDGYSIPSEGFLLTIVDKWSSELNSPIPVHFSSLIPKMLTFTLAISCLTTSNLPWFMDLRFQVPMQYCSLQHRNLLPSPVIHNWVLFLLWLHLFFLELFLHWSPVACWAPIDLGSSSFSVLSFCLFILFIGLQGKNTEVVCHFLLQWTTFCQNSPPWPILLGWPYTSWLIVSLS